MSHSWKFLPIAALFALGAFMLFIGSNPGSVDTVSAADPVITVTVVQVSGNKIYVIGQVRSPGEFPANRPIDVMQALSLAGGLTTFAADKDIKVLRRDDNGRQRALAFNYSDVSKGQQLDTNVLLQPGDVVVVPTSGIF